MRKLKQVSTFVFSLWMFSATIVLAVDSYVVAPSTTETIDHHGVCKEVTNSLTTAIMVPTKTASEWSTGGASFLENPYPGVSAADCPVSCGGVEVGGYCWYASALSQNCTDTCAAEGLSCDLTGTRDYAGSGGTDANCDAVMDALGIYMGSATFSGSALGSYTGGCLGFDAFGSPQRHRYGNSATTCSAGGTQQRACACSN